MPMSQIGTRVRERAHNKCEQCGLVNGTIILRSLEDAERYLVYVPETGGVAWPDGGWIKASEVPDEYDMNESYTTIKLVVVHVDHNPDNNEDGNLKCLCQLHAARHNARHAAGVRKQNKKNKEGQQRLF